MVTFQRKNVPCKGGCGSEDTSLCKLLLADGTGNEERVIAEVPLCDMRRMREDVGSEDALVRLSDHATAPTPNPPERPSMVRCLHDGDRRHRRPAGAQQPGCHTSRGTRLHPGADAARDLLRGRAVTAVSKSRGSR